MSLLEVEELPQGLGRVNNKVGICGWFQLLKKTRPSCFLQKEITIFASRQGWCRQERKVCEEFDS
jgi:hypothetical protein